MYTDRPPNAGKGLQPVLTVTRVPRLLLLFAAAAAAPHALAQSSVPDHQGAQVHEADSAVWKPEYHYIDPRPDTLFESIMAVYSVQPIPVEDKAAAGVTLGCLLAQNPEKTDEWAEALEAIPEPNKPSVWQAFAAANTNEAVMALVRIKETDPGKAPTIDHFIEAPPRDLIGEPMRVPSRILELWAAFYVTGEDIYVRRIIQALEWSVPEELDQRLALIGGAAYWSLANNAHAHSRVLRICRDEAATATGRVQRALAAVIDEAERKLATSPCPEPQAPDETPYDD